MSFRVNLSEITRIRETGGVFPYEEAIEAGRKFYCDLYSSNPYWVVAKNTFILPIVTRTLNNMCSDVPPPPPPPPPPFTGGQCTDVRYLVTGLVRRTGFGSTANVTYDAVAYGPIKSIALEFQPPESPNQLAFVVRGQPGASVPTGVDLDNVGGVGVSGTLLSTTVTRDDGGADDCGDPASPGYPPTALPEPSDISGNVTIINNAGDSNEYSVTVNPDPGGTIVFPPTINVSGISVSVDIGGAVVSNVTNNRSGGGGGANGDTITDVETTKKPEEVEEELPEEEEPDEKTVEKLIAIVVNLTSIPTNTDVTEGRGAPDVYYAGWVEFKNKGTYYKRQFINFQSSRFNAPDENDGYAVTYKKGFLGQITEITEKEQ